MHQDGRPDSSALRGNQALQLWNHENVAHWTVAQYLTDAWPGMGLRRSVLQDPALARVTVADVLRSSESLDAFLAECRRIPGCGARQQACIRTALACVAPPSAEGATVGDTLPSSAAHRLRTDPEARDALLRKWAFVLGNTLWELQVFELAALDLRAEEDLVYRTVILASIQRVLRERGPTEPVFMGENPLPAHQITPVSMRRVAEVTGIPRETVRRHVELLKERGLVDQHPDGGVYAPNSLRIRASAGLMDKTLQSVLRAVNSLIDMGVLVPDDGRLCCPKADQGDAH